MTVFYRLHWADCPPFTADNAWSALWGSTRSTDGSRMECFTCDGTGRLDDAPPFFSADCGPPVRRPSASPGPARTPGGSGARSWDTLPSRL
ncbi:hypothetical protein [Streptomyces sp. NPDC058401]|uniref:hypothetical protein n=1 Tax=Streptomyces sp. NPDC058401 TaxID=3346480 RepID=UPI0036596C82